MRRTRRNLRRPASPALPPDRSAGRPHRSRRALSLRRLCQAALRRRLAPARLPFPFRLRHQLLRNALVRQRASAGARPALGGSCHRPAADYRNLAALGRFGHHRAADRFHVRPGTRRHQGPGHQLRLLRQPKHHARPRNWPSTACSCSPCLASPSALSSAAAPPLR